MTGSKRRAISAIRVSKNRSLGRYERAACNRRSRSTPAAGRPMCSPQYPDLRPARSRRLPTGLCAVSRWCEGCSGYGGESVSQSPLKDKTFSAFRDQNPPFELLPKAVVSPPIFHARPAYVATLSAHRRSINWMTGEPNPMERTEPHLYCPQPQDTGSPTRGFISARAERPCDEARVASG